MVTVCVSAFFPVHPITTNGNELWAELRCRPPALAYALALHMTKLVLSFASSPFQLRICAMTFSNGWHKFLSGIILNCSYQSYDCKRILWAPSPRQLEEETKEGVLVCTAVLGFFFSTEHNWKPCLALWENKGEHLATVAHNHEVLLKYLHGIRFY